MTFIREKEIPPRSDNFYDYEVETVPKGYPVFNDRLISITEKGRKVMAKPLLTEKELRNLKSSVQATSELGNRCGLILTPFENTQYNPIDVIQVYYADRLAKSSKALNILTYVLIGLTLVLAVLTFMLVRNEFGF